MQDVFICQEGLEDRVSLVATKCCKKLMNDMYYEVRIQVIVTYNMVFFRTKATKAYARTMALTRQQYLAVNLEH